MRLTIFFLFFSLSAIGQTLVIQEPCPTNGGQTLYVDESFQQSGGQTMVIGEVVCAPKILSYYVSNSDPTKVVVKYDKPLNILSVPVASAFTLAGKTISNVAVSDSSVILTVTMEYEYLDVISLVYVKPALNPIETTKGLDALSFTQSITNNVISALMTLTSTGTGTGVSTIRMTVSSNTSIVLGANAKFYTDEGGTLGETDTWNIASGAQRTIYLKCTTGSASAKIADVRKIISFGNLSNDGWTSATNAAYLKYNVSKMINLTSLRNTGNDTILGTIPSGVTYWSLIGNNINWTSTAAPPSGVTNWYLSGNNINWTSTAAPPSGVTVWYLGGNNINWTSTAAPPSGVTIWYLSGSNINWTSTAAPPSGVTYWYLSGNNINWTSLQFAGTGNVTLLSMLNYRTDKMSSTDMVILLTNLTNRVGALPATMTINDYADYASPPAAVTNAVNTLKTTKSVTTVTLGQ